MVLGDVRGGWFEGCGWRGDGKGTEAVGTITEFASVGEVVGSGVESWIKGRCFGLEVSPLFRGGLLEGVR